MSKTPTVDDMMITPGNSRRYEAVAGVDDDASAQDNSLIAALDLIAVEHL